MNDRTPIRVVWLAKPYNRLPELPEGAVWGHWSIDRDREIADLFMAAWKGRYGPPAESITSLKSFYESGMLQPQASVFIEVDGNIIGANGCTWDRTFNPPLGGIGMVAVNPQYQGGCIAQALILKSLAEFYKSGIEWVFGTLLVPKLQNYSRLFKTLGCEDYQTWLFTHKHELQ